MSDNPPAFPSGDPSGCDGMTLRDWFAGQALAGIVSTAEPIGGFSTEECEEAFDMAAKAAYSIADAMLSARGPTQ